MKRLLFLIIVSAILALLIVQVIRRSSSHTSSDAVFSLLPATTLVSVIIPDVSAARAEWCTSDLYALWNEPAVRDFLQKPRANLSQQSAISRVTSELDRINATTAFVALTSAGDWKWLGGFRFKAGRADVERTIDGWFAEGKRETSEYEKHAIRVDASSGQAIASTFIGDWFFAANDLGQLQRLLDRFDKRETNGEALRADATFASAFKHMPPSYAGLVYARTDQLLAALLPSLTQSAGSPTAREWSQRLRAFCGAIWFDSGKIRDRSFVAMPRTLDAKLTRSTLALGGKDTFLYLDSNFDVAGQLFGDSAMATPHFAAFRSAVQQSGVTSDEALSAFANELSVIGNWLADSRWPSLAAVIPVKEPAQARLLVKRLSAPLTAGGWAERETNGVRYFGAPTTGQIFAFSPTLAFSDKCAAFGIDSGSVENAIAASSSAGEGLRAVANFTQNESIVPAGEQAFGYFDTALFYRRLDAALRPILLMSAAFLPAIADTVDLQKLPSSDVITRHLSPLVMSQRYVGDGYVTDSVGPFTVTQLSAVVAAGTVALPAFYNSGVLPRPLIPSQQPKPIGSPRRDGDKREQL